MVVRISKHLEMKSLFPAPRSPLPSHVLAFPVCGLGHRVVEDIMKPTMKKKCVLVVNVWGGGNITEVALVSFISPLLSTPIG
jgi:hypothetical protein